MSEKIKPRVLKGFRDYLPEQMIMRSRAIQSIRDVFESFGFVPLDTPTLEYSEILLGKYGDDAEKLLYKFTDHGGRDVCMRYDLTVPLARVVAQYPELPKPFKRYQVATVWRGENTGKGRYREFVQCDVDIVGTTSLLADAECIWVGNNVMRALNIPRFRIHVSHRKLLEGLASRLGNLEARRMPHVFRTVDKLPKQGREEVERLLREEVGLDAAQVGTVFEFLDIRGTTDEVLERVEGLFADSEIGRQGVHELRALIGHARAAGVSDDVLGLDLTIARGLDYYTGAVFETFLQDLPALGSVMSGGRYDGLIGFFAKQELPAVGISVGLDRLFSGMEELKLMEHRSSTASVLFTLMDEALLHRSLQVVGDLRAQGVDTELYYQFDPLGKQLKYADARGIPLAVIMGGSEAAANSAAVKILREGRQELIALPDLAVRLRELSTAPSPQPVSQGVTT